MLTESSGYFTYIVPVALILLIPLLLGALKYKNATVGGVKLMWFMIWLEVVWCTLWLGRASQLSIYIAEVLLTGFTSSCRS